MSRRQIAWIVIQYKSMPHDVMIQMSPSGYNYAIDFASALACGAEIVKRKSLPLRNRARSGQSLPAYD